MSVCCHKFDLFGISLTSWCQEMQLLNEKNMLQRKFADLRMVCLSWNLHFF
uniref:Uncharacterized protein n=1 Tax=Rhizophora mucronata TaxID=61149 RepID=A0A2P2M671_RHIMU